MTVTADQEPPIEGCRPAAVTPVTVEATALESTAPNALRSFKQELIDAGLDPATLAVDACFDESCPLATQRELDRIRRYVRAGSFLGVGTVTVSIDEVAAPENVRPGLAATAERAKREGVTLEVTGEAAIEY